MHACGGNFTAVPIFVSRHSDFGIKSYGESLDSSCEKSRVPVQKDKESSLGLYVTRQLI